MKPRDYFDIGLIVGQALRQHSDTILTTARGLRDHWQRNQEYLAWTDGLPVGDRPRREVPNNE